MQELQDDAMFKKDIASAIRESNEIFFSKVNATNELINLITSPRN